MTYSLMLVHSTFFARRMTVCMFMEENQSYDVNQKSKHRYKQQVLRIYVLRLVHAFYALDKNVDSHEN